MAPVTRRRTKAREASQTDSSFISDAEADSLANTPSQSQKSQDSTPRTKSGARSKRKSTDAGDGETAQKSKQETPKRKRLAVRTRVEESPKGDHRRVHIEATVLDSSERPETVADSDIEEDSDGGAPEPESATKQLQAEAIQKLASQSAEPEPAAPKGKHVVFGDDNDVDKFVAKAAAKDKRREADKENDDDDDSDDEAPEAVSTAAAATQSKKVEQAATDAAEKLAAAQKRKRQERDARFREQAEERKRAEAEAKTARQRISKRDLPDILPAEFLEDSDSDSDSGAPDSHMRKLRKKRKLAEAEAEAALAASEAKRIRFEEVAEVADRAEAEAISHTQRPRDVMLGSTVYRVLAQQADQRLAPKMHKNARAVKDDLMKRKRGAFTTTKKKGFFVKK